MQFAVEEDVADVVNLTPRMRRVRFRGGAQEMMMGYNTETLDDDFCVVTVR